MAMEPISKGDGDDEQLHHSRLVKVHDLLSRLAGNAVDKGHQRVGQHDVPELVAEDKPAEPDREQRERRRDDLVRQRLAKDDHRLRPPEEHVEPHGNQRQCHKEERKVENTVVQRKQKHETHGCWVQGKSKVTNARTAKVMPKMAT